MVTTESATAAATLANRPSGGGSVSLVSSVTFEVVNASTTSAVLRPTQPPAKPITSAMIAEHRQRDVGHPAAEQHFAHAELARADARPVRGPATCTAGSAQRRGGAGIAPRVVGLVGSPARRVRRQARPRRRGAAAGSRRLVGPAERLGQHRIGRLVRRRVLTLVAILVQRRGRIRLTPSGRPNARCDAGSTGGRETGRGCESGRGRTGPDWSPVHHSLLCERHAWPTHAASLGRSHPPYRRLRAVACTPSANCGWPARPVGISAVAWCGICDS